MSPERQRIAIAEACGWTNAKIYPRSESNKRHSEDTEPICIGCRHPSWGGGSCSVPDYLSDLNAMHEAVMECREQLDNYPMTLRRIIRAALPDGDDIDYYHATASQRAKAFLKTIGKWEDA